MIATPAPNASAIESPFLIPLPIESGTITNASGKVQGSTIIEIPAAKLKRNHPNPAGFAGAAKKSHISPPIITAKIASIAMMSHLRTFGLIAVT